VSIRNSLIGGVLLVAALIVLSAACAPLSATNAAPEVFQATLPPTVNSAPIYTDTPTTFPTNTPLPSETPLPRPSRTFTPTFTPSDTLTPSPTRTFTPVPTIALITPTTAAVFGAPRPYEAGPAALSAAEGWTCGDFPCEDDIAGFLQRIQVPTGYTVELAGQFPGQPMQITYGPDGRLYATVLENGTRNGAVYALAEDGSVERYSGEFVSPVGLAFQPGTDVLYVSARVSERQGGGIWRVPSGGAGEPQPVITDLPCCFDLIDNQPNGMTFGPDGMLYMGIGALTDHAEPLPERASREAMRDVLPFEAAILRIQPHTGQYEVFAQGLRNPYDLTFDTNRQMYATDNGLLTGPGDRIVAVNAGAHYGWPYWLPRGCETCAPKPASIEISPDLWDFPDRSLPRGIVAYDGTQFPANLFDNLFVVLWNGTPDGQRVVRINPRDPALLAEGYTPEPFVTGLIRPADVAVAPDGSLVVADFIYGHVWRVRYTGTETVG